MRHKESIKSINQVEVSGKAFHMPSLWDRELLAALEELRDGVTRVREKEWSGQRK